MLFIYVCKYVNNKCFFFCIFQVRTSDTFKVDSVSQNKLMTDNL